MRDRAQVGRKLTPRELEIFRNAALRLEYKEIGKALLISPRTVETHMGRAMKKLGLRNRVQVVLFALRNDIATMETIKSENGISDRMASHG